ncbi:MAG: hypothetical protein MZV65_31610 [Chromatiales bacterium]|nr:hypothetical protein [Chromatiales bacterium]
MGITNSVLAANEAIETLLRIANGQLADMQQATGDVKAIRAIAFDGQVKVGRVHFMRLVESQGTLWGILFEHADTPWNELFIEDRDTALGDDQDGPVLVYRPTPWKDLDGRFIDNTGQAIDAATVRHIAEQADAGQSEWSLVRSAVYQRADQQVANIYWVTSQPLYYTDSQARASALANQGLDGLLRPASDLRRQHLRSSCAAPDHNPSAAGSGPAADPHRLPGRGDLGRRPARPVGAAAPPVARQSQPRQCPSG